jgi:DNA-binding transcriptional ArsR family regulator
MPYPLENERTIDMTSLKALAHPLRVQLLDALSAYGPATASALAERFGESSGATSYHLRQLEKHGFVREDATRGVGRERWWERVPQPIAVLVDDTTDPAQRAASELVVAEWQRSRTQRLSQFLSRGIEDVGMEWVNSGAVMTSNIQLTKEQSAELVKQLSVVLDDYVKKYRDQKADGARPFQIHVDVFPLIDGAVQRPHLSGSDLSGSDLSGSEKTQRKAKKGKAP